MTIQALPARVRGRELVGGLPSLHEPGYVSCPSDSALSYLCAGSAATEGNPEALPYTITVLQEGKTVYGTKSGLPLDPAKVREGRQLEMDNIEKFGVRSVISLAEAKQRGLKLVHAKWLDDVKPTTADPNAVRSRLVATELNTYAREDVTQSTPPLKASRLVVSLAASKRDKKGQHSKLLGRYDVSVAFFHAPFTGEVAVIPPKGLVEEGCCWMLHKAMYGTRAASKSWGLKVIEVLTRADYAECLIVPMTFYRAVTDCTVNCHGDDFLAEGDSPALDHLDQVLTSNFQTKVLPRIGPAAFGGQVASGKHLGQNPDLDRR